VAAEASGCMLSSVTTTSSLEVHPLDDEVTVKVYTRGIDGGRSCIGAGYNSGTGPAVTHPADSRGSVQYGSRLRTSERTIYACIGTRWGVVSSDHHRVGACTSIGRICDHQCVCAGCIDERRLTGVTGYNSGTGPAETAS